MRSVIVRVPVSAAEAQRWTTAAGGHRKRAGFIREAVEKELAARDAAELEAAAADVDPLAELDRLIRR